MTNPPIDEPFRFSAAGVGGIPRHRLRGQHWRRVHRGVLVWHEAALDDLLRLRAAALLLPPGAALGGRSAALAHGVSLEAMDAPTEVVLPRDAAMKPRRGLRIRRALLDATDVTMVRDLPVTTAVRTAFDLARLEQPADAVACLDALLHVELVAAAEVCDYAAARPGWRGVRLARWALERTDGRAESPMESRLRLILVDGGLPAPQVNEPLLDAYGRFLARPDLRIRHVVIEYDGAVHREREVFVRDLRRQNRLVEAGYTVLRYTAYDVGRRPGAVVDEVRSALAISSPRRS